MQCGINFFKAFFYNKDVKHTDKKFKKTNDCDELAKNVYCSGQSLNLILNPGKKIRPAVSESCGIFNQDLDSHLKFTKHHTEAIQSFLKYFS